MSMVNIMSKVNIHSSAHLLMFLSGTVIFHGCYFGTENE